MFIENQNTAKKLVKYFAEGFTLAQQKSCTAEM